MATRIDASHLGNDGRGGSDEAEPRFLVASNGGGAVDMLHRLADAPGEVGYPGIDAIAPLPAE